MSAGISTDRRRRWLRERAGRRRLSKPRVQCLIAALLTVSPRACRSACRFTFAGLAPETAARSCTASSGNLASRARIPTVRAMPSIPRWGDIRYGLRPDEGDMRPGAGERAFLGGGAGQRAQRVVRPSRRPVWVRSSGRKSGGSNEYPCATLVGSGWRATRCRRSIVTIGIVPRAIDRMPDRGTHGRRQPSRFAQWPTRLGRNR
ncbi:hypothetical protein PCA20602_04155 [Pandoraea capi]|uniref:Uncharacterized protein n=1 Tax=Pandoraea capi TaxID=2508286 RepID=A0ABY6W8W9_9BURK|nr:hypothetical protein PCA20602_04155 [Pandoraea capi]